MVDLDVLAEQSRGPIPHPDESDEEFRARVGARLKARVEAHQPPPGVCPACAGYVAYAHTCGLE